MSAPVHFAIEPGGVADPVSVSPRAAHAAAVRAVGMASHELGRAFAAGSRVRAALRADGIDVAPLRVDAARVVAVLLDVARATGAASATKPTPRRRRGVQPEGGRATGLNFPPSMGRSAPDGGAS